MSRRWLVSELFYPDEVSTGFVMTKIAEQLAAERKINVICGPAGYEKNTLNIAGGISPNVIIHRVKVPALNKNKLLSRIFRMLLLTMKMGWKIATKVKKGDQVILVTNPASLLLLVRYIRLFKKFDYTLVVHDVFPENLVASGLATERSRFYRLMLRQYNKAYNAADHLIAVGEDMKILILKKVMADKRISVIPNWADTHDIAPLPDFDKSAYLGIDVNGKVVIGFAGNIGRVQGLEEFINAFVKAGNEKLVLTVIGEGALKEKLQQYVKENDARQVYFLGNKPRNEQIQFLNACDIGLVSLCKGMYGLGVPSKTYNIMAAGKPVLFVGDKGAEVSLYIDQYDCGWAFEWTAEEKLIRFLKELSPEDRDIIQDKGAHALHAARADFSRDKILNRFQQVLEHA